MNNALLNGMKEVLNKHDPIGIYSGKNVNFDEYNSEIKEIYKIFKRCKNLDEFIIEIHKIFINFFKEEIVGSKEKYIKISKDIFELLSRNN